MKKLHKYLSFMYLGLLIFTVHGQNISWEYDCHVSSGFQYNFYAREAKKALHSDIDQLAAKFVITKSINIGGDVLIIPGMGFITEDSGTRTHTIKEPNRIIFVEDEVTKQYYPTAIMQDQRGLGKRGENWYLWHQETNVKYGFQVWEFSGMVSKFQAWPDKGDSGDAYFKGLPLICSNTTADKPLGPTFTEHQLKIMSYNNINQKLPKIYWREEGRFVTSSGVLAPNPNKEVVLDSRDRIIVSPVDSNMAKHLNTLMNDAHPMVDNFFPPTPVGEMKEGDKR